MKELKFCGRCGRIISDINTADYYRHISVKWCDNCSMIIKREQTAARVAAFKKRKKAKDKFRDEQLELLREENELLRKNIIQLRENLS